MKNVDKVNKVEQFYINKVIPLAFDESLSYYECICNIANHINKVIIPIVEEDREIVYELNNSFNELKQYVDDNMLTIDTDELVNYYDKDTTDDLLDNKADISDIPDVSNFITKDVDDLTNYYDKDTTDDLLDNKANVSDIPDVSDFITKDVNDLTNYYDKDTTDDLLDNKADISDIPDVSDFITKDVNDLTNYTTSSVLTTLLSGKENNIEYGSNTNGYYVKFDSGLLIMWGTSNFTGGNTYTSITFPVSLYSTGTSYMLANKRYSAGSTTIYNYAITPQINDANSGFIYVKAQDGSNISSDQKIDWLVLGKWK